MLKANKQNGGLTSATFKTKSVIENFRYFAKLAVTIHFVRSDEAFLLLRGFLDLLLDVPTFFCITISTSEIKS